MDFSNGGALGQLFLLALPLYFFGSTRSSLSGLTILEILTSQNHLSQFVIWLEETSQFGTITVSEVQLINWQGRLDEEINFIASFVEVRKKPPDKE